MSFNPAAPQPAAAAPGDARARAVGAPTSALAAFVGLTFLVSYGWLLPLAALLVTAWTGGHPAPRCPALVRTRSDRSPVLLPEPRMDAALVLDPDKELS